MVPFCDIWGSISACWAFILCIWISRGPRIAKLEMRSYSGFFVVLDDLWYFVTAGHVFERSDGIVGLKQAVNDKRIRITRASIADYFGPDAKPYGSGSDRIGLPTIIDFYEVLSATVFINDDSRNLDFAFLPLREFYVSGVTANGVKPLREDDWQADGEPHKYVLVGFPDEEKLPTSSDPTEAAEIRLCLARMDRCDLPGGVTTPAYPYLAAKLPDDGPITPVGFSGAPIFAARLDADGATTFYWLVAIQSKWYPVERIIVGCVMPTVVSEVRKLLGKG